MALHYTGAPHAEPSAQRGTGARALPQRRAEARLGTEAGVGVLILDGATGTELERRGVDCSLPLWSTRALLHAPGALESVHRAYALAGVDALTACTFRTQARTLAAAGMAGRAAALTTRAVQIARRAAESAAEFATGSSAEFADAAAHAAPAAVRAPIVLGSAPPLADCFDPARVPGDSTLAREHAAHAGNLARAGVDAILAETMNTVREAVAAARAAREAGLPVWVSFVCQPAAAGGIAATQSAAAPPCPHRPPPRRASAVAAADAAPAAADAREARLLSGEPLAEALDALRPFAPEFAAVNCLPPEALAPCLAALRESRLPFGAYPNLGFHAAAPLTPAAFAAAALHWRAAGARLIGGCCGTTPAHLRATVQALRP